MLTAPTSNTAPTPTSNKIASHQENEDERREFGSGVLDRSILYPNPRISLELGCIGHGPESGVAQRDTR